MAACFAPGPIIKTDSHSQHFIWSPCSRYLLFEQLSQQDGCVDISVYSASSGQQLLEFTGKDDSGLLISPWSPDGRLLALEDAKGNIVVYDNICRYAQGNISDQRRGPIHTVTNLQTNTLNIWWASCGRYLLIHSYDSSPGVYRAVNVVDPAHELKVILPEYNTNGSRNYEYWTNDNRFVLLSPHHLNAQHPGEYQIYDMSNLSAPKLVWRYAVNVHYRTHLSICGRRFALINKHSEPVILRIYSWNERRGSFELTHSWQLPKSLQVAPIYWGLQWSTNGQMLSVAAQQGKEFHLMFLDLEKQHSHCAEYSPQQAKLSFTLPNAWPRRMPQIHWAADCCVLYNCYLDNNDNPTTYLWTRARGFHRTTTVPDDVREYLAVEWSPDSRMFAIMSEGNNGESGSSLRIWNYGTWSDKRHHMYTDPKFRATVFAIMLCARSNSSGNKVQLPIELWLHIIGFIVSVA